MRTFAQKPKATQQNTPAASARASQVLADAHPVAHSIPEPDRTTGSCAAPRSPRKDAEGLDVDSGDHGAATFRQDFSRIPIYPRDHQQAPSHPSDQRDHRTTASWPPDRRTSPASGEPLAPATRVRLESILGTRLGHVHIHRGPAAQWAAAAVGAPAYTVGQDIVLGAGSGETALSTTRASSPHQTTLHGEQLLAHEAAHTVQQSLAGHVIDPLLEPPHHSPGGDSIFAAPHVPLPRTAPGGAEERQADAASRGLERPTPGARLAIAAAPASAPVFTSARTFKEIWPEFERARFGVDIAKATVLARELAAAPHDFDDLLTHGIDVVGWLQRHGEPVLAANLLDAVRSVWMIRFVSAGAGLPLRSSLAFDASDPRQLITLGKDAARAGEHSRAFSLLGVANEILSYYALESTRKRMPVLEAESAVQAQLDPAQQSGSFLPRMLARLAQYSDMTSIYDQMREIYGVYSQLEREAIAAGDAKGAAAARANSDTLRKEIKDKYTWGGTQTAGSISTEILEPVEIAEVGYTDTPRGPGLTLYGANSAETTLTQLPGLPSPREVGNNVQIQNLGALQNALMAQTELQAEMARQPEIRKAFGDKPVDFNNTQQRQKSWRIMYGVFQQSGTGALGSLMALIGRYLKAFTVHTSYNVRDWGKSYLDSEMPTDLAGRAERDCGVYALTVAWDVYQTVKSGDSTLHVTFDLTTMLEHVTLVITDKSTGEYYVVNNDQVSPPQHGDPLTQVAPQYGAVRGLPYTVGPAMTVALGSTRDPRKRFHDEAWTRYLAAVDWGLRLEIPPEIAKLEQSDPATYSQQVKEIEQARYTAFYRDQEIFDRGVKALDPLVDALAPVAGDLAKLAPALDPVVDQAAALAVLFIQLGPGERGPQGQSRLIAVGSAKSQALLPPTAQFLFTLQQGQTVHPLARVALGVLHLKAIGGTLTAKQDALAKFCESVPMFKQQMDAYVAAGARGKF